MHAHTHTRNTHTYMHMCTRMHTHTTARSFQCRREKAEVPHNQGGFKTWQGPEHP